MTATEHELSKVQKGIIEALKDGLPHSRTDLMKLVPDDLASTKALVFHIVKINKHLRPKGESVICQIGVKGLLPHYRHVKLIGFSPVPVEASV